MYNKSKMYKDTFREIQKTLNTDQTYIMQLIVRTFIENHASCVNSGYEWLQDIDIIQIHRIQVKKIRLFEVVLNYFHFNMKNIKSNNNRYKL